MKKLWIMLMVFLAVGLAACQVIPETFDITYQTNGGSFTDTSTVIETIEYGYSISEPAITKEGYTFDGWYSDSTFNVDYDFSMPVVGDITLHAKWEVNEVVITYYTGDEYNTLTAIYNDTIPLPDGPLREGYTFDGWYFDEDATILVGPNEVVTEDVSVYAKFVINTYTLTFFGIDGELYHEDYEFGETVLIPTSYELEGYDFLGVYETALYTDEVSSGFVMPAEDSTLYLLFEEMQNILTIYFVPSRPTDEILFTVEPLELLMLDALNDAGYNYTAIEILVGSTYESSAEALLTGAADIAFLPSIVYVPYKDVENSPIDVILAATRAGLNKVSTDAKDWNDGLPTFDDPESQVPSYTGLIIAGPSTKGQELANKVNSGTVLDWNDFKDLTWCVRYMTSSSGYIYPELWLYDTFGKTYNDFGSAQIIEANGYGTAMALLALENCDIANFYGDARRDYADNWEMEYGRDASIWSETNVIAVTKPIMNDVIAVNTDSIHGDLLEFITQFFLALPDTPEGLGIMSVYAHQGYMIVDDEDYDPVRDAQSFIDHNN